MNRLGLNRPSELSGESKELYDKLHTYTSDKYTDLGMKQLLVDDDERLMGPFGVLLHTPSVGEPFTQLSRTISQIPGLSGRHREIAIVTTGIRFNAAFELHAHKMLALKNGVTQKELDAIVKGQRPEGFDEESKVVYDVAHELAFGSGPLSEEAWNRAVKYLTKSGATHLVQVVGFYCYVCVVLRGFDCKIPNVKG